MPEAFEIVRRYKDREKENTYPSLLSDLLSAIFDKKGTFRFSIQTVNVWEKD